MKRIFALCLGLTTTIGCNLPEEDASEAEGLAILGAGNHTTDAVNVTIRSTRSDGLDEPRDLAFNPIVPGQLWVVNAGNDSVVLLHDAGVDHQEAEHIIDPYALHFMDTVSSIAFGKLETFATCHESRNTYNGQYAANDFMGPTLWSSDLDVFASSNPDAVEVLTEQFGMHTDLGSHLDMLHQSPLCTGIAFESDNVYWVFDGLHESITMNDFQTDHGVGWDDHSDGRILRYAEGEVSYEEGVSSHLVFDQESKLLYIADSGNGRIAVLDTTTGTQGDDLQSVEPYPLHAEMNGADLTTLVQDELEVPSGLELHDGLLYVSDYETGIISAYTLAGERVDWLQTQAEGIMGMGFDSDGSLWYVDADSNAVVQISVK